MLIFLLKFIMLLIISGIFIVSFYNITRHQIIIEPNNKITVSGDLLRFWSRFFERVKTVNRIYYSGGALEFKFSELKRLYQQVHFKLDTFNGDISKLSSFVLKENTAPLTLDEIVRVEALLQCKVDVKDNGIYFLYIEKPVFWFPDIIRKPFSACPRCMSSVFGSIIWVATYYFDKDLFQWSAYPLKTFFVYWLIFVLNLSFINNYIQRKYSQ